MAGAIGTVTASMATLYNENSRALISNNFDFTLIKFEAPAELDGLGMTISKRGKKIPKMALFVGPREN